MKTIVYILFSVLLLNSLPIQLRAQERMPLLKVMFSDSLQLEPAERMVNNTLRLVNQSSHPREFNVDITAPEEWQTLFRSQSILISPGDTGYIPVVIFPTPEVKAEWKYFLVKLKEKDRGDTVSYSFHVKAKERNYFVSILTSKKIRLFTNKKSIPLSFYALNAGNTPGNYTVNYRNESLALDRTTKFSLAPQKDTQYSISFTIPDESWKNFRKDDIYIRMIDTTGFRRVMIAHLYKVASQVKENKSAFQLIPLRFETGIILLDKKLSYFGALGGSIAFSPEQQLDFQFRTKQFGLGNNLHNNVLNLNYKSPKFELFLGQGASSRQFITDGISAIGRYNPRKDFVVTVGTTIHTRNSYYKTDHVEMSLSHKTKKISWEHRGAFNHNRTNQVNGYLLMTKAGIISTTKVQLSVELASGIDDFRFKLPSRIKEHIGLGFGYDLNLIFKKWMLASSVKKNDRYLPGIYKGGESQHHLFRVTVLKKSTLGAFYYSNLTRNNFLLDTIYNSTVLSFNIVRWGVTAGYNTKGFSFNAETGKLNQIGITGSGLTKYDYIDGRFSYSAGKHFRTSFHALKGWGRLNRNDKNSRLLELINTGGNIQYSFVGVSAFYLSEPQITMDTSAFVLTGYQQTLFITPTVSFSLFKKLAVNLSYTISRSLYDNQNTGFVGTQINYSHPSKGIELGLYGTLPTRKSAAQGFGLSNRYINFSLIKNLNMPFWGKRKFFDLKMVLYLDENDNLVNEKSETLLKDLQLNINELTFITNNEGCLLYKNIPKGNYQLDLTETEPIKGWVPAYGTRQQVPFSGSTTLYVAYKRSKLISGRISILSDTATRPHYTNGIKVIAIDSSGQYFSTLCDEKGEYFMNVPSNHYTVSLNQDAFSENSRPELMSFKIDLINNKEQIVNFLIKQQKRKVRLLKDN